jgi:hypothetical protein
MAYERPGVNDTIEINGKVYGEPHIVSRFEFCSLEEAKSALPHWNRDHERHGVRFSIVKDDEVSEVMKKPMYTLYSWVFLGYKNKNKIKPHRVRED